ncbi:MarR family winged helix-turn-helix transcriptional regulator [Streptomyces thermospinosisporus]|uniref:MarR family winged helix-turn-helix transcriptional regulator n=1 Tax=Streptomyces thermospinosisporus TaxID=161482 RepID=A0ABP4JVN8_9ACTN
MQNSEAMALSAALLAAAGELVRRIHEGVAARGFEGVRPVHGFAFARLAPDGATVTELAAHLGVTKQAASQLVEEMVRRGYAERRPHPVDARARLVVLTEQGWACARAAEEAAAEAVRGWSEVLGEGDLRLLWERLARIAPDGPIRPGW